MSKLRSIVISVFASNIVVAGLSFLFQVLLARSLSVDDFGRLSLILSLIAIIQAVVAFGFPGSAVIFYGKSQDKPRAMAELNGWFVAILILVGIILIPVSKALGAVFHFTSLEYGALVSSVLGLHIFEYALTRRQEQGLWTQYNRALILKAILRVALGFGAAWSYSIVHHRTLTFEHVLVAYTAWSIVIVALGLWDVTNWMAIVKPWRLHRQNRRTFLYLLANLGLTNTFAIISMRSSNLIIEHKLGSEALGIYTAANTLALIMPVLTNSMMRVFVREAATDGKQMLNRILKTQKRYALLVVLTTVLGLALSKPLVLFVFGSKYAASADIFRLLLVAYIGGVVFTPLESYFYANQQSFVMKLKGMQMVVIVLGTWVAVAVGGLPSVPWALILARVLGWSTLLWAARKYAKHPSPASG